jgi:hypothetical protein
MATQFVVKRADARPGIFHGSSPGCGLEEIRDG